RGGVGHVMARSRAFDVRRRRRTRCRARGWLRSRRRDACRHRQSRGGRPARDRGSACELVVVIRPLGLESRRQTAGAVLLLIVSALAIFSSVLSPNPTDRQFPDRAYAPPTAVHVRDAAGFHWPFIYRQVVRDRLMRDYGEDNSSRVPLEWAHHGQLV